MLYSDCIFLCIVTNYNFFWNYLQLKIYCFICNRMSLIASPRDDFEVSPKRKNCIVNGILTPFDNNQESISSIKACTISQFQNKCSIVSSSSWQKVQKALSFTLILYSNLFVPRIHWLILYCNHCSLVFCVTIKGSLNISLHFVSSKPKAKISSHFFWPLTLCYSLLVTNTYL